MKSWGPDPSQYRFIKKSYISTFLNILDANSLIIDIINDNDIGFNILGRFSQTTNKYQCFKVLEKQRVSLSAVCYLHYLHSMRRKVKGVAAFAEVAVGE